MDDSRERWPTSFSIGGAGSEGMQCLASVNANHLFTLPLEGECVTNTGPIPKINPKPFLGPP